MPQFEYKVLPAPRRGEKARGVKTTEERYALMLTNLMNEMGRDGWDYVRADTLPVDERAGLTGTKTTYQNMLVFRRTLTEVVAVSEAMPVFNSRLVAIEPSPAANAPKLGPAEPAAVHKAPAIGSASSGLAAE